MSEPATKEHSTAKEEINPTDEVFMELELMFWLSQRRKYRIASWSDVTARQK